MAREFDRVRARERRTRGAGGHVWNDMGAGIRGGRFHPEQTGVDSLLRISRKMAEDFETQACAMREQATTLTEKTLENTMELGQKLTRAKEPQEIAKCQSEFLARQAQMLTDQTRAFGEKVQNAAHEFAQTASSAMADVGRRAGEGPSIVAGATSRTEQSSKRQRAEA